MKMIDRPCGHHLGQRGEQRLAFLRRQHRGRLVEDQDARVAVQRLEDLDPLPLADRQAADPRLRLHRQAEALRHLQQPGARRVAAREGLPQRLGAHQHVVEHAEVVGQREVLVHHADAGGQRRLRVARRASGRPKTSMLARVGHVVAEQDRHQRRLAGAVLAEQRQHLAGLQRRARSPSLATSVPKRLVMPRSGSDYVRGTARRRHRRPSRCTSAVDFGWLSSTLTVNLPARMSACLALTLATMSAGTLVSKVPSGASSEPLCFIIE